MRGLHQIVAGSAPHDAITHHVLEAQAVLRDWGYRSEVVAGGVHPALARRITPMAALESVVTPEDTVILHYSIDSPIFARAAERADAVAMHYHNITPAEMLWRHAPRVAAECARGRRALAGYRDRAVATCADSEYNADELRELGFVDPVAVGIFAPQLPLPAAGVRSDGPPQLLFVGRGIPNKAQRDLVLALAALHEAGCPARLTLVGSWDAAPSYRRECEALAARLGVDGDLDITGVVGDETLGRLYRRSDVFVCLSDHEGFCVPLLEAMRAEMPIVAYAAGAVPETLGRAGLLLPGKAPSLVAEAVMEVLGNDALRDTFAAARAERLDTLGPDRTRARLRAWVDGLP